MQAACVHHRPYSRAAPVVELIDCDRCNSQPTTCLIQHALQLPGLGVGGKLGGLLGLERLRGGRRLLQQQQQSTRGQLAVIQQRQK